MKMNRHVLGLFIAICSLTQIASASLYDFGFSTDPVADGWTTFGTLGTPGLTLTPGHLNDDRSVMILNNYDPSDDVLRGIYKPFSLVGETVTELKINLTFSCNTLRATDMDFKVDIGNGIALNMIHQNWENVNGAVLLVPEYVRPAEGPVFTKYAYYQAEFVINDTGAYFNLIEDVTGITVATHSFTDITLDDVGNGIIVYVANQTRPWYIDPNDGRRGTTAQAFVDNITIDIDAAPELLLGDSNRDGVVSAGDYAAVQSNFGNTGEPGILGDANADGVVSAGDYASVQANFGNTAGAEIVPEPATISLLAVGALAMRIRRRK